MILTPKLLPLLNAMQSLQGILPAKAIRQCTRHFHFAIAERQLAVSASDIEMTARIMVPCAAKSASPILVPPSLIPLIKDRDCEEFDIFVEKNVATIPFGRDKFEIPLCADVNDWPYTPSQDNVKERCMVSAAAFGEAVKRATMAAQADASRYGLNSVCLRTNKNRLDVCATDGKQMLLTKLQAHGEGTPEGFGGFKNLLPLKSADVLSRLCESAPDDGQIEISVCGGKIFVSREGVSFSTLMVSDSKFPDYERVLNVETDKEALIPKAAFETAITRSSAFMGDETKALNLEFSEGTVLIKAAEASKGKGVQALECDYQGEPTKFCAHVDYIRNACKISGEHVRLSMGDAKGVILSGEGDVTYGFMPRTAE